MPCPSFILYVAALVSNANRGSSRELLSSRKQALIKTFVHHQGIYSHPIPQQTSMGNHQWLCKLAVRTMFLHPAVCKARCLRPRHGFLAYSAPNSPAHLRVRSKLVWKKPQVLSVSKQPTEVINSCFPSKQALASNAFRPVKLPGDLGLASGNKPTPHRPRPSLTAQNKWRNLLLKVLMWPSTLEGTACFCNELFRWVWLSRPHSALLCADWHWEGFFQGLLILNAFVQEHIGPNSEGAGTNHLQDQADNSFWFDPGQRMSAKVSAGTRRLNTTKKTQTPQRWCVQLQTQTIWAQKEEKK